MDRYFALKFFSFEVLFAFGTGMLISLADPQSEPFSSSLAESAGPAVKWKISAGFFPVPADFLAELAQGAGGADRMEMLSARNLSPPPLPLLLSLENKLRAEGRRICKISFTNLACSAARTLLLWATWINKQTNKTSFLVMASLGMFLTSFRQSRFL